MAEKKFGGKKERKETKEWERRGEKNKRKRKINEGKTKYKKLQSKKMYNICQIHIKFNVGHNISLIFIFSPF